MSRKKIPRRTPDFLKDLAKGIPESVDDKFARRRIMELRKDGYSYEAAYAQTLRELDSDGRDMVE